jgi:hypothetical protein
MIAENIRGASSQSVEERVSPLRGAITKPSRFEIVVESRESRVESSLRAIPPRWSLSTLDSGLSTRGEAAFWNSNNEVIDAAR